MTYTFFPPDDNVICVPSSPVKYIPLIGTSTNSSVNDLSVLSFKLRLMYSLSCFLTASSLEYEVSDKSNVVTAPPPQIHSYTYRFFIISM